jgi:hypothetical protein
LDGLGHRLLADVTELAGWLTWIPSSGEEREDIRVRRADTSEARCL